LSRPLSTLLVVFLAVSGLFHFVNVQARQREIEVTGIPVAAMSSFDRVMVGLMMKWGIPGGALAVVKDGRLVLAHGYGLADTDAEQLVQPDSLFRICSISKPITAVAILKLLEEGRLNLDDKAFAILDNLKPRSGKPADPRIYNVSIRHLLQHSGGWDREKTFDPMFISREAASAVGAPAPASCETVIRYMLERRLDFEPGTRYAYSNFGYCVLGRIIEKLTNQTYEEFVKSQILAPMGITDMRIGRTLLKDRVENEVRYYDYDGAPLVQSVFTSTKKLVLAPYGGFYLEALDAHGGWIASAIDLVRFAASIDGHRQPAFLRPETVQIMTARPAPPLWVGESYWYAMGWLVRPQRGAEANWWHAGSLPGSQTFLVRTYHGLAWAALFNTRLQKPDDGNLMNELDESLWRAESEVASWPGHDLFGMATSSTTQTTVQTTVAGASQTTTTVPLTSAQRTQSETESTATAAQAVTWAFSIDMTVFAVIAFAIVALTAAYYLRRRGK